MERLRVCAQNAHFRQRQRNHVCARVCALASGSVCLCVSGQRLRFTEQPENICKCFACMCVRVSTSAKPMQCAYVGTTALNKIRPEKCAAFSQVNFGEQHFKRQRKLKQPASGHNAGKRKALRCVCTRRDAPRPLQTRVDEKRT